LLGQAPSKADPRILGAQSDKTPKSMASPVIDLAEMEGGQSTIAYRSINN